MFVAAFKRSLDFTGYLKMLRWFLIHIFSLSLHFLQFIYHYIILYVFTIYYAAVSHVYVVFITSIF